MKRIITGIVALAMAASCFAACGGGGAGSTGTAHPYPGTPGAGSLVYNLIYEPQDMNTATSADGASFIVNHYLIQGLVTRDANANPVPAIASSWVYDEENITYTFTLRQDATWENGQPVTAHDFVFAWRLLCNPGSTSNSASQGFIIKNGRAYNSGTATEEDFGVKAVDDYTLEVQLENPCGYALFQFTAPYFNPINQAFYESCGANYATEREYIMANGPYKMTEWVHENHITVEKNEGYYGESSAGVDKITFVMIGDTNAALNAYKAGEIDILPQLSAEQVSQLQGEGIEVGHYNNNAARFILFNTANEYFANENIRKAFSYAFDRSVLVANVLGDGSEAAYSYCPAVFKGVEESFIKEAGAPFFTDDTAAAAAYLEQGLAELGKTKEEMQASGISIVVDENSVYQRVVAYLLEQWKTELGIEVTANVMPKKSRIEAVYTNHDFVMAYGTWGPDYNDPNTNLEMFETGHGLNGGQFTSEEFDTNLQAAAKEANLAQRMAYLINCEKVLMEQAAIAPMYFECTNYIVSGKVQNYNPVNWNFPMDFASIAE